MAVDLTDGLTPPPEEPVDLFEVLGQLPLMTDNFYLRMQAHNIAITDRSLNQMERDLLERELEREHTPVDEADFLNAWSQMWVFGFFELMRTWNALASKFRNHSRKLMRGDPRAQAPLIAPRWVAENPAGAETALDEAIKRANSLRRMLAEVRTGWLLHEAPVALNIVGLARRLCGSIRGRELGLCGRRCRAGYRRQHAVSGAD
jgi:hypothetical protein